MLVCCIDRELRHLTSLEFCTERVGRIAGSRSTTAVPYMQHCGRYDDLYLSCSVWGKVPGTAERDKTKDIVKNKVELPPHLREIGRDKIVLLGWYMKFGGSIVIRHRISSRVAQ